MKWGVLLRTAALGLGLPALAAAQGVPYDDFEAGLTLDPARWSGHRLGEPLDHVREIQLGQLHLSSQGYAQSELGIALRDPGAALAVFADVQVEGALARECTPPAGSEVALVLHSQLFRSSTGPDVAGRLELVRRTSDGLGAPLEARCRIVRCLSSDCSTFSDLVTPAVFGSVALDDEVRIGVAAAGANRVVCHLDAVQQSLSGATSVGPPGSPRKTLSVQHSPGCPASDPVLSRRTAMEVFADDVSVTLDATRDLDSDGIADVVDNCDYQPNPTQSDGGGIGPGSGPDGIGDACQCGDLDLDRRVTPSDATLLRGQLTLPGPIVNALCRVHPGTLGCDILQASVLLRVSPGNGSTPPGIAQLCDAALP